MLASNFKYMYHQAYISDKPFPPTFQKKKKKNHGRNCCMQFYVLVLMIKDHLLHFPHTTHVKNQLNISVNLVINPFFHIGFSFQL